MLPAVSAFDTKSSENSVFDSSRDGIVKMRTQSSSEPMSSSTDEKVVSNPT